MAVVIAAVASLTAAFGLTGLRADDSAMSGESGSPQPMTEHPSISMVREDVTINPATMEVKARFVFTNNGPATTVLMGFPETSSGDGTRDVTIKIAAPQNDFHSFVDGAPIHVTELIRKSDDNGEEQATIWWTKSVHFAAGQTRIVVDHYFGGAGNFSTGNQFFNYILKSGASWKGPIGRGIITCDLSGLPYSPIDFRPSGWVRHGNTAVLDFSNLKPTNDIYIAWFPSYTNVWINGVSVFDRHLKATGMTPSSDVPPTELFTWDTGFWTPVFSRRRGTDVWLPAKATAHWLGGKFDILDGDKQVKITYGDRWVVANEGSKVLSTYKGPVSMPYVCVQEKPLRGLPGAATMVSLKSVVEALNGTYSYDPVADKVTISMPPPD